MALKRTMATGLEEDCYRCGKPINPTDIIVQKPSDRPIGYPGTFGIGSKGYVWVHEKCSPLSSKVHRPHRKSARS